MSMQEGELDTFRSQLVRYVFWSYAHHYYSVGSWKHGSMEAWKLALLKVSFQSKRKLRSAAFTFGRKCTCTVWEERSGV